jgi:hypothetical protein
VGSSGRSGRSGIWGNLGILGIENRKLKKISLFPSRQQLPNFFLFLFFKFFSRVCADAAQCPRGQQRGGRERGEGRGGREVHPRGRIPKKINKFLFFLSRPRGRSPASARTAEGKEGEGGGERKGGRGEGR